MSKSVNRALYSTNIYGSEWTILKTIHDQGTMTQTALANYLNIEPATISKTIRQLMKKNLIMRQSGEDKREKYIYLTPLAIEQYNEWFEVIAQNCRRVLEAVNVEEQKILIPRALSKQFILFRTGERYHLRAVHLCIGLVFANLAAKNYPESYHFQCF